MWEIKCNLRWIDDFKRKKLSTIMLHNFLRATTFVSVSSPSDILNYNYTLTYNNRAHGFLWYWLLLNMVKQITQHTTLNKKLWTIQFYNFLRSTTFILVVSLSENLFYHYTLNCDFRVYILLGINSIKSYNTYLDI